MLHYLRGIVLFGYGFIFMWCKMKYSGGFHDINGNYAGKMFFETRNEVGMSIIDDLTIAGDRIVNIVLSVGGELKKILEINKIPVYDAYYQHLGSLTIASGPVIIENGKVLLIKDTKDLAEKFPGGKSHVGESREDTSRRELGEELGLICEVSSEPYVVLLGKTTDSGAKDYKLLVHYRAKRLSDKIILGEDIEQCGFYSVDHLPDSCLPNVAPVTKFFAEKGGEGDEER